MAVKTKKVILFIVEGPTDENSLSPILKKFFQNEEIRFHVVHGDITSEWLVNNTNVIKTINDHIKAEMDRYGFRRSDMLKVIHLIDTDGAFVSNDCVVVGDIKKLRYDENKIFSPNPARTIERNFKKAQVLNRLYTTGAIGSTSYSVYYFSRNIEHVMHNIIDDLTDDEKMDYADRFVDTYHNDVNAFIHFLSDSDFTVQCDYPESWLFIFKETNSLHRHCNLHLLFRGSHQ